MRCDGDVGIVVVAEHLVDDILGTSILQCTWLCVECCPVWIIFRELRLELEGWEVLLDIGFGAATIASMRRDALTQILLDSWDEWLLLGKIKSRESQLGGIKAAVQWASVVRLWRFDLLVLDQGSPKLVDLVGLLDTSLGEVSICPRDGLVAIKFRPVTVPSWGTEVGLCSVVKALTMTAHEEELILLIVFCALPQGTNVIGKTLP